MATNLPSGNNRTLDTFNDALRTNAGYRAFLRTLGVNPDGPVRLSGTQRSQAEQWIRQRYPQLAGTFQVDPAGNVNTDHGLSTAWSNPYFRYPLIAGGALAGAGALGAFGGGAGGASGASLGGLYTATPPAIASQGVSAGVGAGAGAAGAAGAGGGLLSRIGRGVQNAAGAANGFNGWQQAALAALSGLPALLANKGPSDEEKALYAQAQQLAQLQQQRITHQNPLFEAVTQLAMSRMPTASQRPLTPLGG